MNKISGQSNEANIGINLESSVINIQEKVEEDFTDIDLREGDSAYIFYCKSQLQKNLSSTQWNVNNSNGCISIYNKIFREKFEAIDINLASKLKLQIWMKRPEKERTSLQLEVAGAGPEYKELKLKLANSLKSKFTYDKDIILGKETVGIVMTLNMKALGIIDKIDDTTDKLSLNNEAIQDSVKKFIGYLDMNIINDWIVNDAVTIINSYIPNTESSPVEDAVITELEDKFLEKKSIEILDGGTKRMKKMITQSERMNIESIDKKVKRGNIVLDPSFQRNYVYTEEKAASVIQSILLNMPLGVVYLAEIDNKNLCVYGQQRLTSILKYINNEFCLKKLDVLTEFTGFYFKDLNEDMKDVIYDYSIEITKVKECDYEQIYFLYEKLNVGSVKLNAQEIRRCVYAGQFNDMLEKIVEEGIVEEYFKEIDNNRLRRVEVLINALSVADNPNYKCSRKKLLNDYMEKHKNDDEKAVDNQKNNILRVFRLIEDVLGDKAFKFKDKDSLTLTLVYPIYYCFSNLNDKDIRLNADNIREVIINLMQADVCTFNPNGNVNGDAKGVKYTLDIIENIILKAIGENCDARTRIFPKEWRQRLFDKQEGICGICNQKMLDISNTEIDHIIPFSQGGDTILNNAQLTHLHCNRSKNNRI